jgi:hypothetical protein
MAQKNVDSHKIDTMPEEDMEKYQEERCVDLEDEANRSRERMLSDGHGFGEPAR